GRCWGRFAPQREQAPSPQVIRAWPRLASRIAATYEEHGLILAAILQRQSDQAQQLLKTHIELSKQEVRKITLHRLAVARG
ncbi:FCD domain-containing protein, partial [Pseudomonas yamanorum]|uniref:FCD domain-containing protein n=1 Tax=Pseudomonas yamanorum TaxID=515393 RepID=UPI00210B398C